MVMQYLEPLSPNYSNAGVIHTSCHYSNCLILHSIRSCDPACVLSGVHTIIHRIKDDISSLACRIYHHLSIVEPLNRGHTRQVRGACDGRIVSNSQNTMSRYLKTYASESLH